MDTENSIPQKLSKKHDGGHRIITVRIKDELLTDLEYLSAKEHRSRNKIINMLLRSAIDLVQIEEA